VRVRVRVQVWVRDQRALHTAPRQSGLAHAAHRLAVQHALVVGGLVQPRRHLLAQLHLGVAVALDEAQAGALGEREPVLLLGLLTVRVRVWVRVGVRVRVWVWVGVRVRVSSRGAASTAACSPRWTRGASSA